MTVAAIIVASGRGTRFGGSPKQWRRLGGRSLVDHAVGTFRRAGVQRIVVVHHADDAAELSGLDVERAPGGATRGLSVRAGLEALAMSPPRDVLIHDGARPCVSTALIHRIRAALEDHVAAAPALPVTDALWRGGLRVAETVPRDGLLRAQTPQGFRYAVIREAHRTVPDADLAADDVAVARAAGIEVAIVAGEEDNIKVTHPDDLARAGRILGVSETRIGQGFDVHAFGPGDHVWLGGVRIPHDRGIVAHSDGDVLLHAATDAILGVVGAGDIGTHFPPSDPRWRGEPSATFLRHAVGLAAEAGWVLRHLDLTLVAEGPRIGPHRPAMLAAVSDMTGLPTDAIGLKATTAEGLGFAGRGEGIVSMALATLVRT